MCYTDADGFIMHVKNEDFDMRSQQRFKKDSHEI